MKQAEKLPAWTHPDNDQPPEKADQISFRPKDESWFDPIDGDEYIANGFGQFEGFNGRRVREHPEHTLKRSIKSDEAGRLAGLKAAAKARDLEEVLENELSAQGVRVDYCEIGKKGSKVRRREVLRVFGLTEEITVEIFKEFNRHIPENDDPDFYFGVPGGKGEKEREEFEEIMTTIEKEFDAVEAWTAIKTFASDNGISDERVIALHKQTALDGGEPAFTPEALELLQQYLTNEVEVLAAKSAGQLSLLAPPAEPENDLLPAQQEIVEADKQVQDSKERELLEREDGTIIDVETGEIVSMTEAAQNALVAEIPPEYVKPETNEFVVDSEEKANWLTGKFRAMQKDIERAASDKKELSNQCDVIKRRIESKMAGFRWKFGQQLHAWALANRAKNKKSIVLPLGTIKLKPTARLMCIDEAKYKAWWSDMKENVEELQMYAHTVSRSQSESQILEALEMGLDVPGYTLLEVDETGDWDVGKSPTVKTRKKKGASESFDDTEEGESAEGE